MTPASTTRRTIRAPRGPQLTADSWQTEAPMRMLMNNLDPDVAEQPDELVVYGGIGRAARNWEAFDRIVAALRRSEADETLLVQSGKPVGVFRTHADAPRVLIANSNLVPHWATWEHFHELDRKGLMMYGQMTAGSWIYIGTPGHRAGHLRDLRRSWAPALRRRSRGPLDPHRPGSAAWAARSRWPPPWPGPRCSRSNASPAASRCACVPAISTCRRRPRRGAGAASRRAAADKQPISVGLLGNAAEVLPELVRRGVRPDIVTDQTSAHDPVNGYLPKGWTLGEWEARRESDPNAVERGRARLDGASMSAPCWHFHRTGIPTMDYGNNIRQIARGRGRRRRLRLSRLRAGLYPPAVLPRHRAVPLGGAVGRPGGHLPHRRQGEGADAGRPRICTTGSTWRASESTSRACRRGSAGSGSATATGSASPSTRWWRRAS